MKVVRKYGLVRAIAFILKLLAWIVLLLFIAVAVFGATLLGSPTYSFLPPGLGAGTAVASVITGILWFLPLYALGSVLSLLLDIEENTRALAALPPEELPQA